MAEPVVDAGQVAEWLSRLVRVPSVTPLQAGPRAGTPGEGALAAQVAEWLRALGGEVVVEDVLPGRPNVYGLFAGRDGSRWAAVDAHLDTVGVETMAADPFSGRVADGRVWGRGATDTKATLAVALALLEAMHERRLTPEPNLLIAATADEEGDARGAPAFAGWLRGRGLVLDELAVAEPTLCAPVHGHKGVLRLALGIEGTAAHSSKPHLGRNAVSAGLRVAAAMEREHERLAEAGRNNPLGPGTLVLTLFRGGEGLNIIPPSCRIVIDRRVTAGDSAAAERDRLTALAREASPLPVSVETIHAIDAFYREPSTPWVRRMAAWAGAEPTTAPYCTNAWAYTPDVARQCVVVGPGSIDQAHTEDEWVEVAELGRLADIFARWWGLA